MQFKIKNVSVKISFSFFAVFLLMIIAGDLKICVYSLAASLLHEMVHIIFMYIFGSSLRSFTLSLFGANIVKDECNNISAWKEGIINISAPVFNIIFGVVFLYIKKEWAIINFVIGIFNILPFKDFDGGKFIECIFSYKLSEKNIKSLIDVLSLVVVVLFGVVVFTSIKKSGNYYSILILYFFMVTPVVTGLFKR